MNIAEVADYYSWCQIAGNQEIREILTRRSRLRARKGIFITTSDFSKEAEAYAASIQSTIVLINGAQLAELMIDHGIGVTLVNSYDIKRLGR